ncbi:MAG TPA: alpha/beta hydrolase [Chloroflexota bacterium]|nr:alpha/beta hydrolase [Chloroflexota bacterium]
MTNKVVSKDGTTIGYTSVGRGPAVLVIPGVLSMAADYAAFASALGDSFTVHVIERRGRGESGPQGDDYSVVKECEDLLALQHETGASLVVGHSYGGLVALEVARNTAAFTKVVVYEPGVSISGSMGANRMSSYERKLAAGRNLDALAEYALAVGPRRMQGWPTWLMKLMLSLNLVWHPEQRHMLDLLPQLRREWGEIARLDSSYENYREVVADVLLMYGGRSDSLAVDLQVERLPAILSSFKTRQFPTLDHFGIERTAPREVADAVAGYFVE